VWLATPPAGLPTSADFVTRTSDPRGGDNGYNTFKRLPNGHGVSFGGFSHDQAGNNAVLDYDPVANVASIVVANTPWAASPNVSGRTFLGNRDNHSTLVVDGKFWVMSGERGVSFTGNYRGILDTSSWHWTYIDDNFSWPQVVGGGITDYENAAYGRIESLDAWYMFGGEKAGNPNDGLIRLERNASGAPYKATEYRDIWGNPSFTGSQKLAYVNQSHWDRGTKLHVYGGMHEDWTATDANGSWLRTPGKTLYEIDVQAPSMTPISINSLPDGARVEGPAVFGYRDPARDLAVISDGKNVNVYSYALGAWFNVPVNTAADPDRQTPSTDGAGRQGFYSPEAGQFIILGGHSHIYGLRLNYGAPPPPSSVSCTLASSNTAPTVGSSITLTGTCTGNPTSYAWTGCSSTSNTCATTSPTPGTQTYSLVASNGSNTSAPASISVNWQSVAPPPPPPPPPNPGNRTVTATAVPYTGPARVLGAAKHLDFARLGNRWYKLAGDHGDTGSPLDVPIPPPGLQDGQQVVLSFNVPANDWREDTPYYLPSSYGVQGANPDDAMAIVVGNEAWVMNTATNRGALAQPAGAAQQVDLLQKICAYSPPSAQWPLGHWRVIGPPPWVINGDRAWRGFYDPVKNRIVMPTNRNGAVWAMIDVATGADLTQYDGSGVAYQYGDHIFSITGVAPDFVNRVFYVYDLNDSSIYQVSMDNPGGPTKVATLPEPVQGTQAAIKLTWHPDLRAVIVAATKINIYEVDSGAISSVARPDGFVNGVGTYVPTSTIFFDPDTHDIVSIGTIDWDTGRNPGVYWRLKIQ